MSEKDQETHEGISRRRMLKRIGAGAAVAWSAPVVTSLASPAFAQTPTCTECAGDFCFGQTICGSDDFGDCPCAQIVGNEANCFCYGDDFCLNRTQCSQQSDCPDGQVCVHTCCDAEFGPVCFPACGAPRSLRKGQRGPRGSHR
jgi:hypothetical protein